MSPSCSRRQFVAGSLAIPIAVRHATAAPAADDGRKAPYRLLWGDLHNHNAVGYGVGTLGRSIEIARAHLDFFAFTGHASWHDMPLMPGDRHMKWVNGFRAHRDHWPATRRLIQEANTADFVALLGYEWHSSEFGDYCMIFPDDQPELYLPDHVDKLLDFAARTGALAIPHHLAYKRGWRGANFDHFRPEVSPVVEIFSEHGCCESVNSTGPYIRHSQSGRSTENTVDRQMANGLRFGFVGSTDTHRGYPGACGEGVTGVWAEDLSPRSIFEALRARRCYAATGDRIALDVRLNGRHMGSELPATADRELEVTVTGQDSIASIELVRNGVTIDRRFPEDSYRNHEPLPGRVKCRIQYGWGPWAALNLASVCDWEATIEIEGGRFIGAVPAWQSGPFDEDRRDRLEMVSQRQIRLNSFTSREKCFAQDPTKAVVLELEGGPEASLALKLSKPVERVVTNRLGELARDNVVIASGGFFGESCIIHRLVAAPLYAASVRFADRNSAATADSYYVRVRQYNDQWAWSSPIWVG